MMLREMWDLYAAALNDTPQMAREELAAWRERHREAALWQNAATFRDLGELTAQFCEGKLQQTPDHDGPRCEETVPIATQLAHANRRGFVTTGSQPGEDRNGSQQRAVVEGWATPETAEQLERLARGTRLQIQVSKRRPWRADYSRSFPASRYVRPDGTELVETEFGFVPGGATPFIDLDRGDLIEDARYVTIHDPEWGDHSLLWDRLAEPDWDNPRPPTSELRRPVLDAPPAAKPHQPRTRTATPIPSRLTAAANTTGVTVTASISDVRVSITQAINTAQDTLGPLAQAQSGLENTQAMLQQAMEGSAQADVSEALAMIGHAVGDVETAMQAVQTAIQSAESVGGRL